MGLNKFIWKSTKSACILMQWTASVFLKHKLEIKETMFNFTGEFRKADLSSNAKHNKLISFVGVCISNMLASWAFLMQFLGMHCGVLKQICHTTMNTGKILEFLRAIHAEATACFILLGSKMHPYRVIRYRKICLMNELDKNFGLHR